MDRQANVPRAEVLCHRQRRAIPAGPGELREDRLLVQRQVIDLAGRDFPN